MKNKFIIICLIITLLLCSTTGCSPLTYPLLEAALSSEEDTKTTYEDEASVKDNDSDDHKFTSSEDGDKLLLEGIEEYNEGDYADAIDKLLAAEKSKSFPPYILIWESGAELQPGHFISAFR